MRPEDFKNEFKRKEKKLTLKNFKGSPTFKSTTSKVSTFKKSSDKKYSI